MESQSKLGSMTMSTLEENEPSFFRLCEGRNFAVLLRAILDRVPVLVVGPDEYRCDRLSSLLFSLVGNFRQLETYATSFLDAADLRAVYQGERDDPTKPRAIFLATSEVAPRATREFDKFDGWVFHVNPEDYREVQRAVLAVSGGVVACFLNDSWNLEVQLIGDGLEDLGENSHLESLLKSLRNRVNQSIVGVERIVEGIVVAAKAENPQYALLVEDSPLLDYSQEKESLLKEAVAAELDNFYISCFCAFTIFKKMEEARAAGLPQVRARRKSLGSLLPHKKVDVKRVFGFIRRNWGVDPAQHFD
ncbi:MAG: hypothetical protein Kow0069_11040 [Promethearchaeota archaeon]